MEKHSFIHDLQNEDKNDNRRSFNNKNIFYIIENKNTSNNRKIVSKNIFNKDLFITHIYNRILNTKN